MLRIDDFGAKFQSYLSVFFVFGKLGDGMFFFMVYGFGFVVCVV